MKKIFAMACLVLMSLNLFSTTYADTSFTSQQTKQIQQIIHDYLITNPTVLIEASEALRKQEMMQAEKTAMTAIKNNKQELFHDPSSPVEGNPKGTITLVEFYDYQCGHCKVMSPIIKKLLSSNHNVKIIYKDFPIFGDDSIYAAKATLAAYQINPNFYTQFHHDLMAKSDPLDQSTVEAIAKQNGYNINAINKKINDQSIQQQLDQNKNLAQAMKLGGTPAFILANKDLTQFQFIPGSTTEANLQTMINNLQ